MKSLIDEHFQIQLCRLYPHLYTAMRQIVQQYDSTLQSVEQTKDHGALTIEASFGRLAYGEERNFDRTIPVCLMNTIFTLLSSFDAWDSISDWFLVYEYYTSDQTSVRISYENKVQTIQQTTKRTLSVSDCSYSTSNLTWKLREYLTRVTLSIEQVAETMQEVSEFSSVDISMRKYFVIQSFNLPSVSFQFELVQSWVGETVAIAEERLKTSEPRCTFSCKVMNVSVATPLTAIEKSILFTSLLLKMQDFLDIPMLTKVLQQNDRLPVVIDSFEIL